MKTIGFFGDSFCEHLSNQHSIDNGYDTYIEKTRKKFNLEIKNIGMGGSSIWDTILLQLNPLLQSPPDICVFIWTIPQRLFHRTCRSIHMSSALAGYNLKKELWFSENYPNEKNWFSKDIWDAAQQYFTILYDEEKSQLEYLSFIQYIDNNILPNLQSSKIIHLWSFASPSGWNSHEGFRPKNISYVHRWNTGIEIRPALISLSVAGKENNTFKYPKIDERPNHLDGDMKNEILSGWITDAIENYENGKILDYTIDVEKLWND